MIKKILCVIMAAIMVLTVAAVKKYHSYDAQIQKYYESATSTVNNVLLYDLSNEKLLFSKNADQQISIGSVVKLVTALTAFQVLSSKDICRVGTEATRYTTTESSLSMIKDGQYMTFEKLLYTLLLPSGCDSAYTIAVNCARKATGNRNMPSDKAVDYFIGLMNDYAAAIGCKNSSFTNPDGQDAQGQHMTLEDILLVAKKVSENDVLMKIVSTSHVKMTIQTRTGRYRDSDVHEWKNTNKLIDKNGEYYNEHVKGVKTGYTTDAGYTLVSLAERDDKRVICIIAKCRSDSTRFNVANKLCQLSLADSAAD